MPHKDEFSLIQVQELHPTFGAAIYNVDFSQRISDDVFAEILAAITKVINERKGKRRESV